MEKKPAVTISKKAADRILHILQIRDKPSLGIKVGVKTGGCSGLSYDVSYADEVGKYDEVIEYKDNDIEFKVIIEPNAVMYLLGTEMDYIDEKMKSGFVFNNPNAKGHCGCGESFHV